MNSFAHDKRKDNEVRPTFPRRAVVTAGMPYGNKDLHFGHIGGVFVHADIFARFLRDRIGKENVLFVSGTDCYGSSIVEAFRIAVSQKKGSPAISNSLCAKTMNCRRNHCRLLRFRSICLLLRPSTVPPKRTRSCARN